MTKHENEAAPEVDPKVLDLMKVAAKDYGVHVVGDSARWSAEEIEILLGGFRLLPKLLLAGAFAIRDRVSPDQNVLTEAETHKEGVACRTDQNGRFAGPHIHFYDAAFCTLPDPVTMSAQPVVAKDPGAESTSSDVFDALVDALEHPADDEGKQEEEEESKAPTGPGEPVLVQDVGVASPFDSAFTMLDQTDEDNRRTEVWGETAPLRVVVHEAAHLYLNGRIGNASLLARKTGSDFRTRARDLKNSHAALAGLVAKIQTPVPVPVQGIADAASTVYLNCGKPFVDATEAAAKACAAMRYPSHEDTDPNPTPQSRGQLLVGARTAVVAARQAQTPLNTAAAQLRDRLKADQASLPAPVIEAAQAVIEAASSIDRTAENYLDAGTGVLTAHRILDRFIQLAAAYGFQPFTGYAASAHEEWFAETFALAVLRPQGHGVPAADNMIGWIRDNFPDCPDGVGDSPPVPGQEKSS